MTTRTNTINSNSKVGKGHKTLVCLPMHFHKSVMQKVCLWPSEPKHPLLYNLHN